MFSMFFFGAFFFITALGRAKQIGSKVGSCLQAAAFLLVPITSIQLLLHLTGRK
jgi:hypothetical protein